MNAGSVVSTVEVAFNAVDGSALPTGPLGAVTEVISEWGGSLLDASIVLPAPPPPPPVRTSKVRLRWLDCNQGTFMAGPLVQHCPPARTCFAP